MQIQLAKIVPNDDTNAEGIWVLAGVPNSEFTPPEGFHIVQFVFRELDESPSPDMITPFDQHPVSKIKNWPGVPPLTPFQVWERLSSTPSETFIQDGWEFSMDGPQMSPADCWFPIAFKNDVSFVTEGSAEEVIIPGAGWLCLDDEGNIVPAKLRDSIIEQEDFEKSKGWRSLGPMYDTARRITDVVISSLQEKQFKRIVEEASKSIADQINERVENSLWLDLDHNLHGRFWSGVERVINGIICGEEWALEAYVGPNSPMAYRASVLEAIAKHIPEQIEAMQIDLLKKDLEQANRLLDTYRNRY